MRSDLSADLGTKVEKLEDTNAGTKKKTRVQLQTSMPRARFLHQGSVWSSCMLSKRRGKRKLCGNL